MEMEKAVMRAVVVARGGVGRGQRTQGDGEVAMEGAHHQRR
jgi:hypothetical protein